METFELQLKHAAEKSLIKFIADGGWIMPDYQSRIKLPAEWMADCWKLIDQEKVKEGIAKRIENELADRIMNHIAAELSTDIKQILSVQERREKVRAIARDHIDEIMKAGS